MNINYRFKNIRQSDYLKNYVKTKLEEVIERFQLSLDLVEISFESDGTFKQVNCILHGIKGTLIHSKSSTRDLLGSVNKMVENWDEQIRRMRNKITSDHRRGLPLRSILQHIQEIHPDFFNQEMSDPEYYDDYYMRESCDMYYREHPEELYDEEVTPLYHRTPEKIANRFYQEFQNEENEGAEQAETRENDKRQKEKPKVYFFKLQNH